MKKSETYIKLYRGIEDHWLWDKKPFSEGQAWIDLLLMANHRDHKGKARDRNEIVTYERGTVNRSISYLADRWGWSRGKVNRFLSLLKSDGMLSKNSTTHGTTITIENYSIFQNRRSTNGQPTDNQRSTDGQPTDTNNNYEEYKKNDKDTPKGDTRARARGPKGKVALWEVD